MWRQDCTFISHILGPQPTQTLLYGHNKKNETLSLTNLSQKNNVRWCHATHKSVQPLNGLYCSILPRVQTSFHWINTYFILSRKNCKYNIMKNQCDRAWRATVKEYRQVSFYTILLNTTWKFMLFFKFMW